MSEWVNYNGLIDFVKFVFVKECWTVLKDIKKIVKNIVKDGFKGENGVWRLWGQESECVDLAMG